MAETFFMAQYTIDTTHSEVGFSVRHMMFAKVRGRFKVWTATLEHDPASPDKTSVRAEISVASIDTGEPKRDGHLQSPDFFDAAKFPQMTFVSKRVEGSGAKYRLVGDLTIRDVTREITVSVEQTGTGKDPWGNERVGFSAKTSVSRNDFGLTWNQALETGGVLVGDSVEIELEVQAIRNS
jgi:polyisoprenoid-binding protein YceI